MLVVNYAAARYGVQFLGVPAASKTRITVGLVALGLLLVAEIVRTRWPPRIGPSQSTSGAGRLALERIQIAGSASVPEAPITAIAPTLVLLDGEAACRHDATLDRTRLLRDR